MVANLILKQGHYYCDNCRMSQPGIPPRCGFCGYEFSNWETIIFEREIEEKRYKDESNLYRENQT